jgi:hypothetical protein
MAGILTPTVEEYSFTMEYITGLAKADYQEEKPTEQIMVWHAILLLTF